MRADPDLLDIVVRRHAERQRRPSTLTSLASAHRQPHRRRRQVLQVEMDANCRLVLAQHLGHRLHRRGLDKGGHGGSGEDGHAAAAEGDSELDSSTTTLASPLRPERSRSLMAAAGEVTELSVAAVSAIENRSFTFVAERGESPE